MEFNHTSVLLDEVIENLNIRPDGIYVDGTLGGAGHSSVILSRLGSDGRLIGIDQDEVAIQAATKRLRVNDGESRVSVIKSNYRQMKGVLAGEGIGRVDGILLDLGVSSVQFDDAKRGFSYKNDAPLDMRMDTEQTLTAADIVNTYSQDELKRILAEYGEERFAASIAKQIVKAREQKPVLTTGELVEIIRRSMPEREKNKKGHPARKTFQALRIECNRELEVLQDFLEEAIGLLNEDGRLCIITFHSLEDRIVKKAFMKAENPCVCPPDFPVCACGNRSLGEMKPHKPILPTTDELADNPRARSAKLRVFIRKSESNN